MEESKRNFEIITKTIICGVMYILLSIMIMFFIGIYKVEAQVLPSPDASFLWDGNINTTPTDTWFLGSNKSVREDFFVFNMRAKSFPMTYVVLTWCTSNIGMIEDMYISNTNYTNNFINDGKGVTYITGDTCTYNTYEGWIVKKQFVVGKWEKIEDIDDEEYGQTAGGYLNFKNHYNWNVFYQLTDFYLSDTDDLTTLSEAQNNLRETIDAIEEQTSNITKNQDKLKEEIKEAILGTGLDEETKKPTNKEQYENTHEKEEDLLGKWKPTDEELGNIELEIEQEPANYMWNLLERILNTNERILYLVMSILVIGVIKLIMGR